MIKIETPLASATVGETSQLANSTADIIKENVTDDPFLIQLGTELGDAGKEMESAIATSQKKLMTEELVAADDDRDNAFIALKFFILAYIKWELNKYVTYAKKIWTLIKEHGLGLDRESYEEESALLNSLIKDFEEPEIVEAFTILKQEEILTYLKDSQAAFYALYQQALKTVDGKEIISATKQKKGTLAKLKRIVTYINVNVEAKPEVYGTAQAEIANLISQVNQKIRLRASLNAED